ncbi:helix-turn-helix domain-containing protein [Haloferula sp. A504]|uniref:helix-turn-helix domain-containing protein n=1 Tax=Haloferula sp. A504 TaxID=3373601 RepID=UPI0031C510D2|nr:helix-turn-helix domain-containing protein [Verrucomicrobiaceae bacterium E54]
MSDPFKKLARAFEKARDSHTYRVEAVSLEFTESLLDRMKEQGVNRTELARRLGTSLAYVSKVLNQPGNLTVDSLVKISDAVGCDLRAHLLPRECEGMWINVQKKRTTKPDAKSDPETLAADSNEFALAA